MRPMDSDRINPAPAGDLALHRELSANLVGFGRLLRRLGASPGPGEFGDALSALKRIDLKDSQAFYLALRTTLAKSREEQEIFDQHFDAYWQVWDRALEPHRAAARQGMDETDGGGDRPQSGRPASVTISDWLKGNGRAEEEREVAGYSPVEVVTRRDFSAFGTTEIDEMGRMVAVLAKALATRLSRRCRHSHRRGPLDLCRTLRLNLPKGGDLLDLSFRRRKRQKLKLVLLCDMSKSMDLYGRFLIQFIYSFQNVYRRLETFVFSTSLHRITSTLKSGDLPRVLLALSSEVPDWSGGTRIGASLHDFLTRHGTEMVDRNTVVLILSDGWDTGDIDLLEDSMREIQKRCRCLVWLNPLMGHPGYQPSCRGMQAALPFVDIFAPAHNLASLRQLAHRLGKIQGRAAFRRAIQRRGPSPGPDRVDPPKSAATAARKTAFERFGISR